MDRARTIEGVRGSLRLAKATSLFVAFISALYAIAEVTPSPGVEWLLWLGPLMAVILWLERDTARTRIAAVHDLGFLLWFSWPVFIPWYAWKTRGHAGWRLAALLFMSIYSASISYFVVAGLLGVLLLIFE